MPAETPAAPRARLNPFAFPAETDLRFLLLLIAIGGSVLFVYNSLFLSLNSRRYLAATQMCVPDDVMLQALRLQENGGPQAPHDPCMDAINYETALWQLGGLGLLLVVTGGIYLAMPAWRLRGGRLVPLTADDAPDVVAYLAGLCREAGVRRAPAFVWNPLRTAVTGLAFGRAPTYYVELSGGLVTQFYTDQPVFRAVLLHELAHLRNSDVDESHLVVAIWPAFLITAVLPYALLVRLPLDAELGLSWRMAVLAILIYLMRNAVLREREIYADLRASTWDGPAGALRRVVAELPPDRGPFWRRAGRLHPAPAARAHALDDTRPLFTAGFWDALAVGVTGGIAYSALYSFLGNLLTGLPMLDWAPTLAALADGAVAAAVAGAWIWRAAFAALADGRSVRGLHRLAFGLALGIAAGQFISFSGLLEFQPGGSLSRLSALDYVAYWGLGFAGVWLLIHWLALCARTWLSIAVSRAWPRAAYLVGLAAAGGLLAMWLGDLQWGAANGLDLRASLYLRGIRLALFFFMPPSIGVMLALVALWAFPLAAWLWQRRPGGEILAPWTFLDPPAQRVPAPPEERKSPLRGPAWTGLFAGAIYASLVLAIRTFLGFALPSAVTTSAGFKLAMTNDLIWLAAACQIAVALGVVLRPHPLRVVRALFAAFVAGTVASTGFLLVNLIRGGSLDFQFGWSIFSMSVARGATPALLIALLVMGPVVLAGRVRATAPRQVAAVALSEPGGSSQTRVD